MVRGEYQLSRYTLKLRVRDSWLRIVLRPLISCFTVKPKIYDSRYIYD